MRLLVPLIAVTAALLFSGAHAGTVYKAVDAKGRIQYADRPAASGTVKVLHFSGYPRAAPVTAVAANVPAAPADWGKVMVRERRATGTFVPNGEAFRPSTSRHNYLYVMPGAQPYLDIIRSAAAEWGAACRLTFEYIDRPEPGAARPNWNNVIVVDYGPGADAGAGATAFRKTSSDGNALNYTKIIISQAFGKRDMRFVVLHELGHAIGLPHATDPAAIMSADNGDRRYYIQTGEAPALTSTDINGCSNLLAG